MHNLYIKEGQPMQWQNEKGTKIHTVVAKILHRKHKIEQDEPH